MSFTRSIFSNSIKTVSLIFLFLTRVPISSFSFSERGPFVRSGFSILNTAYLRLLSGRSHVRAQRVIVWERGGFGRVRDRLKETKIDGIKSLLRSEQQFEQLSTVWLWQEVSAFCLSCGSFKGLPFNCTDVDIFKFFAGLDIVDVFLVNKDGRFSGEAFVVFAGHMQAELALQRDRQNMGRRYVEVFRCKKQEYYNAIASEVSEGAYGSTDYRGSSPPARRKRSPDKDKMEYTEILKMRGLPYSVRKSEIVKFFGDFHVMEDKIQIAFRSDGKATGEAYVEFASAEEARKAMSKDKMLIGSRYVELFPSTPDEARQAASRSR
ncbi:Heterogeneous nuclear ribonucleoprotein F [Sesamum angolense]|uniref:Heterogeneous nuclear ribonucleoprotein F n=2 Tax=Sesamum TaxID=4181 RepID=A0AAE1XD33_9LAMI|nr:Heterogeneous nuclear ribonucleoprotein F [Sesamum angolense]